MSPTLPYAGNEGQPDADDSDAYRFLMAKDAKEVLWRNIEALMLAKWGRTNLLRLAEAAGVGDTSVHRLKPSDPTSVGLEIIVAIGRVFRRAPYQLLDPRPGVRDLSETAAEIGRMFDALEPERQASAYALIVQILEFGRTGPPLSAPPSPVPAAGSQGTPPASSPASPAPKRARKRSR